MRLKAFKAVRPRRTLVQEVSCLPYDVFSETEARKIVAENPNSFLAVTRPETLFPAGTDPASPEVYERARVLIDENIASGTFKADEKDTYYIYRQTVNGRSQTGLVACYAVDDYLENRIKKHELTRLDKEDDRTRHIDVCNAQTGLVFLFFREGEEARKVLKEATEGEPLYDFTASDGVQQTVWQVSDEADVAKITAAFEAVPEMYIADGHHRSASAAAVCKKRRTENPDHNGSEEYNYFLAVSFPYEELLIMPYYRVVKDLNGLSTEEFLDKLSEKFSIEKKDLKAYEPAKKGEVALYVDDTWYKLSAKPEILKDDPVGSLDVTMLQENVLKPILGIEDIRTSDRIDFIGGIRGLGELEKRCHEDMKAAFAMRHTTVSQLMRVADDGDIMPPKSTWFEPKLQSGLFIHQI